jgi:hypothetical protein
LTNTGSTILTDTKRERLRGKIVV